MEKLLYSVEEAAEALSMGRSLIYELIGRGDLESITVGRRRLVPRDALVVFVERQRQAQDEHSE